MGLSGWSTPSIKSGVALARNGWESHDSGEGAYVAFLLTYPDVYESAFVEQTLSGLNAGDTYSFSVAAAIRGGSPQLVITVDGSVILSVEASELSSSTYSDFVFQFTASAASHVLRLENVATGADIALLVDNIRHTQTTSPPAGRCPR